MRAMGKALGLWTVTAAVSSWNAALLEVKGAETQGAGRRGPSLGTGSQGKQHRTPKHAEEAEAGWMQRRHGLLKNASRVPELPSWGGAALLGWGSLPWGGAPWPPGPWCPCTTASTQVQNKRQLVGQLCKGLRQAPRDFLHVPTFPSLSPGVHQAHNEYLPLFLHPPLKNLT